MLFRLSAAIVLVAAITARVSAQVEPNWNGGVNYSYDGAGNIYRMGTDTFKYDAAGRLVESKANGIQRNYAYDRYGNRTDCTHAPGMPSESDCQYGYTVNAAKNRIAGVTYDDAGNLQAIGARTYTYDALNMLTREAGGATPREYVYDANGERIAVYEVNAGKWRWTFRDPSGKVLREFTSTGNGTANWKWTKDYIWRDGLLLATRQIEPGQTTAVTYHHHLDHLGTPRRITNDADQIVGAHGYHAFGPEMSGGLNEPALSVMKYTGHERDTSGVDSWDTLDYMHARYCNGTLGRFLSVDPVWDLESAILNPQMWNRYSYVLNSPLKYVDPSGAVVNLASMTDDERRRLLASLNAFTGNEYGVDGNANLLVLNYGANASSTATQFLDDAIGSPNVYAVIAYNPDASVNLMDADRTTGQIRVDFADFANINMNGLPREAFYLGENLFHELVHTYYNWTDPHPVGQGPPATDRKHITGPVVDFTNRVHAERDLPLRGPTYEAQNSSLTIGGRARVPFIDPRTGRIIHVFPRLRP